MGLSVIVTVIVRGQSLSVAGCGPNVTGTFSQGPC